MVVVVGWKGALVKDERKGDFSWRTSRTAVVLRAQETWAKLATG